MRFNWFRRWRWTSRIGHRREAYLHASFAGWREAWRALRRWIEYRSWLDLMVYTNTRAFQHECYCPTGSTTRLKINVFGLDLFAEMSRSWRRSPCLCERVGWCVSPEWHQDEIEDYGRDRLIAEFPEYRSALEDVA